MVRQSRKLDHLKYALILEDGPATNGFSDFTFVHNCIPNLAQTDIDISSKFINLSLKHPIIINAITGGADDVTAINSYLAEFAYLTNSAMAIGSQYAALENPEVQESYKIVRAKNPDGLIFANLGAHATAVQAKRAVDMIGAQALQIHLNVAQEVIMSEGDRDFTGYLNNIAKIVEAVQVPVIVKEVGCGIASEQARLLADIGVAAIDVGGMGGTNFIAIEAARSKLAVAEDMLSWGIPTAVSTVEVAATVADKTDIMVSGGIRTPLEVVKALALGGTAVGMATPIVRLLQQNICEDALNWFSNFLDEIKRYMLILGAGSIKELLKVPIVITGQSNQWLTVRGFDVIEYAKRKKHG